MATLLLESFDYYATADLPAKWDSASGVTINPTGGRMLGGAAAFDATLNPSLVKALTWGDTHAYLGFAVKVTNFGSTITLAEIISNAATYALKLATNGVLHVTVNGVVKPGASAANAIQLNKGAYVELSLNLAGGARSCVIRVNEADVGINQLSPLGDTFQSLTLGGGIGESGTWLIDDVYLLDGVPAAAFMQGIQIVDNASFLGSTHIEALYPTQEGLNTVPPGPFDPPPDPGYTPWTPDPGPGHFDMVNSHPPTDATQEASADIGNYNSGTHTLDTYGTYGVVHPDARVLGFGLQAVTLLPLALYAVQWIGRLASNGVSGVKPTVREPVDQPSSDIVAIGDAETLTSAVFAYFAQLFDRDPIDAITAVGPVEWTFGAVFPQSADPDDPIVPGREFGETLSS